MEPVDLHNFTQASDPQLSPDGSNLAFVVSTIDLEDNTYRSRIWVAPTNGSQRPRPLTEGVARDSQPRWSPDGQWLAFTSSRSKNENGQTLTTLHLLPFGQPGETVTLHAGHEAISGLCFSPDGDRLAFSMRTRSPDYAERDPARREPRQIDHLLFSLNGEGFTSDRLEHIYVVAIDGSSAATNLTPGRHECTGPVWFRDGTRIGCSISELGTTLASDVAVIDLVAGEVSVLTDTTGVVYAASITPDDSELVVVGHDDCDTLFQNASVGLMGTDGSARSVTPRWLATDLDRTFSPFISSGRPTWTPGGIIAGVEDRGDVHLYAIDPDSSALSPIATGKRMVTGWSVADTSSGQLIAFTASSGSQPGEVYLVRDGEETRITAVSDRWVERTEPVEPEHFLATSDDGEVDAWIIRPKDFDPSKTYPMLLNIHGGPFTQYGNVFLDEFQMQAAAGYVVVYSNPRGSSGRDESWGAAIRGPKHKDPGDGWGTVDYDDVMNVLDTALERFDFIDRTRLGVLGGSYGGYLTSWIVTHTDRFQAACSERSANNLLTLEYASDLAGFFQAELGPSHLDDPEEYLRMSPMTYVHDLHTPLLIVHSEDDLRCPVEQATQLFVAAKQLGKDVEYWLFPGEDHELSRSGSPFHRKRRAEIILEFFDRRLT